MQWGASGETTNVFKFGLGADAVPLEATGGVAGSVLNPFSMDEEADTFRIATTTNFGPDSTNNLFVLEQVGDDLETVGSVTDLALGERLRSARFVGDRARTSSRSSRSTRCSPSTSATPATRASPAS